MVSPLSHQQTFWCSTRSWSIADHRRIYPTSICSLTANMSPVSRVMAWSSALLQVPPPTQWLLVPAWSTLRCLLLWSRRSALILFPSDQLSCLLVSNLRFVHLHYILKIFGNLFLDFRFPCRLIAEILLGCLLMEETGKNFSMVIGNFFITI